MKNYILILFLILSLGGNIYLYFQKINEHREEKIIDLTNELSNIEHSKEDLKKKYVDIKGSFIELARSQQHILDVLMKKTDLYNSFDEYKDLTKEEFQEKVRRKIVKLGLQIEDLEKNKY